jgi:hypothetical protein
MGNKKGNRSSHFKHRRRRGSYLTVTGKYPSPHNPHCLFYEGFRERDLFVYLNFVTTVLRVDDHIPKISYKDGKRIRSYTPDARIQFRPEPDGTPTRCSLAVEVKLEIELERNQDVFQARFDAARAFCVAEGSEFRVVTEKLLVRPAVRSLRFLYRYRQYRAAPELVAAIGSSFTGSDPLTLASLIQSLEARSFESGKIIAAVWHLAALQKLKVGLDEPLSTATVLTNTPWGMPL